MAKAKVKVVFYTATRFNSFFSAGTVISKEQFEEYVKERTEELRETESQFEDYLSDNYTCREIFDMNENEKTEIRQEYSGKCEDDARTELEEDWNYNEFETEVEVPAEIALEQSKGKCPCPCNQ